MFKIQTWTIFRSTIFAHYTAAVFSTWADFSSRSLAEKKYLCVFVCVCVCAKQGGRRGEGADIYLPAVVFRLAGWLPATGPQHQVLHIKSCPGTNVVPLCRLSRNIWSYSWMIWCRRYFLSSSFAQTNLSLRDFSIPRHLEMKVMYYIVLARFASFLMLHDNYRFCFEDQSNK